MPMLSRSVPRAVARKWGWTPTLSTFTSINGSPILANLGSPQSIQIVGTLFLDNGLASVIVSGGLTATPVNLGTWTNTMAEFSLDAVVPPGAYDITYVPVYGPSITNPGVLTASAAQPPTLTLLSPDNGDENGGVAVTIYGTDFDSGKDNGSYHIWLGDAATHSAIAEIDTLEYVSSTEMTGTSGKAIGGGTVDVWLTSDSFGNSNSLDSGWTFNAP